MTDIVERLRDCFYLDDDDWHMIHHEAAGEIERLRGENAVLMDEIERLRHNQGNLKEDMKTIVALRAENAKLREALTNILHTAPWSSDDGHNQCIKEARSALQKDEGG